MFYLTTVLPILHAVMLQTGCVGHHTPAAGCRWPTLDAWAKGCHDSPIMKAAAQRPSALCFPRLACLALLGGLALGGCMRQQQEVAEEPSYRPPVFTFARGDLAGDDTGGFRPIVDPAFPTLPRLVDAETTPEQLASMALQVALSEHAWEEIPLEGIPAAEGIARRKADILAFWQPQHEVLKEIIAEAEARREAWHQYQLAEGQRRLHHERRLDAMRLEWDERLRVERLRILPLVPPDLHARLIVQMRTADPQRSRWCLIAP
ncbi:MAG: hypothetical protein EA402_08335 [Planctomycetota bacterium]|nr:MAG: hypothetical protein EA402_08335 [Planctomycetota bacterium]